jgi:hypothetical protein
MTVAQHAWRTEFSNFETWLQDTTQVVVPY